VRIGWGDLTERLLLMETFVGIGTVLGVVRTPLGMTTKGLGLAERISMSGPSSRSVSRRESLLNFSCTGLTFCALSPVCHGGVPAIWQHNA